MPVTRKTPPRLLRPLHFLHNRRPPHLRTLGLLALLVALATVSAGCSAFYPPQDVTSQGASTRGLYDIVFLIAAIIFFAVEGAIVWIVVRYRRKPTDTELPAQFHGNNLIEIIWTVIPTVIVLFLFVVSWQTLDKVEAKDANPSVRVVAYAQRFSWDFRYIGPDGRFLFATDAEGHGAFGTLTVPPGVPIEVHLKSPDVIHAFYVPKFLFKRDVVPNVDNVFDFTIDPSDAGETFRGQCAELCGIGHGTMIFDVKATKDMAEYQAWLQGQIDNGYKGSPAPGSQPPASALPASAPPGSQPPASAPPASAPPASPVAGGPALQIAAANTAFDKNALEATAGAPFTITFQNNDAGVPHNVEILDAGGANLFKGDLVTGVKEITYQVPALGAGAYQFRCIVHPSMTGTLTVK